MTADEATSDRSVEDNVFDMARQILDERTVDEVEVQAWATGSEIAHRTDLDRDTVLEALTALGNGRLHIRSASGGMDIEVLGVDHTTFSIESDQ